MSFGTKPITLFRAVALALVLLGLFTLMMPCLSIDASNLSLPGVKRVGLGFFATSIGEYKTSFWSVMLIINSILLILLGGLAVFGILKDRKLLVLPFALIGFITFFLALFQKLFIDYSDIHVGRGAWLLLFVSLLAAGAAVLDHLAEGKPLKDFFDLSTLGIKLPELPKFSKPTRAADAPAAAGWTCPNCGAVQPEEVRFCGNCGSPKPAPRLCPGCGKVCQPNEVFCADCGTRL